MSRSWTDDQLIAAVAANATYSDVLRALNLRTAGGNFVQIRKHVLRLSLNISHFRPREIQIAHLVHGRRLEKEQIFVENSHVSHRLMQYIRTFDMFQYACVGCGNGGQHNGHPLTLQVHHKNGIHNDNRPENLSVLCPNCHSQTDTHCGRNRRRVARRPRQPPPRPPRKVDHDSLRAYFAQHGNYSQTGRVFGISDSAARKIVLGIK